MKLWGGRFAKETDELVNLFNASLSFDQRLYHYDILGSIVHAKMLGRTGIITEDESRLIVSGLKEIETEIEAEKITFDNSFEDIHSLVEAYLTDKIGDVGGKLHTARSRNDQVALDMRLYLRAEVDRLSNLLKKLLQVLIKLAESNLHVIMPGYTHLQRAQPVTFAHHLMAYYFKFKRDYERWQDNLKRINILPLGAGALAGTTFPIDREWVAAELNFNSVSQNSLDSVSDRDFIIEFLSVASTVGLHLSRFSEELIIWSSSEFNFIEFDDAYATGSSIMPQKKNPDIAELTRGKSGRIFGHLLQLLTTLKGLPLAYNKDMQEDKEGVFDTIDTLKLILQIFPDMLTTMTVNHLQMDRATKKGFLNATDLADYLVTKGIPFRQAHTIVGKAVLFALENNLKLEEIDLEQWKSLFPDLKTIFTEKLYEFLNLENCVLNRRVTGGTSPVETKKVISKENKWLFQ